MLLDAKKKGKEQSKLKIFLKIFVWPYVFLNTLVKTRFDFGISFCETTFFIFRNIGKLKYFESVESVKI
jgi:hypothetical protein